MQSFRDSERKGSAQHASSNIWVCSTWFLNVPDSGRPKAWKVVPMRQGSRTLNPIPEPLYVHVYIYIYIYNIYIDR